MEQTRAVGVVIINFIALILQCIAVSTHYWGFADSTIYMIGLWKECTEFSCENIPKSPTFLDPKFGDSSLFEATRSLALLSIVFLVPAFLIQFWACYQRKPMGRIVVPLCGGASILFGLIAVFTWAKFLADPLVYVGYSFAFFAIAICLVGFSTVLYHYALSSESGEVPQNVVIVFSYLVTCLPFALVLRWILKPGDLVDDTNIGLQVYFSKTFDWKVFNWHPLLMVLGFGTLFSQAALHFRLLPFSHDTNKMIHILTQTLAVACTSAGLAAVVIFKNATGNLHFYSTHAWIGISMFSLFLLQYVGGLIAFLLPKPLPPPVEYRAAFRPWHMFFGVFLFMGTTIAIISGITDRTVIYGTYNNDDFIRWGNSVMISMVFCGIIVFYHQHFTRHHEKPKNVNDGYHSLPSH